MYVMAEHHRQQEIWYEHANQMVHGMVSQLFAAHQVNIFSFTSKDILSDTNLTNSVIYLDLLIVNI